METGLAAMGAADFWIAFFAVIGFIWSVLVVSSYVIMKVHDAIQWFRKRRGYVTE